MTHAWVRATVFGIASVLSYAACDSSSTTIGGETNWLKTCATDSQCTGGAKCLCGVCTKTCDGADSCGPPELACASSGSRAFAAMCGGAQPGVGICLEKCGSGCGALASCVDGLCVANRSGDGGPPDGSGGAAPNVAAGGASGSGGTAGNGGASGSGGAGPGDASPEHEASPVDGDARPETSLPEATVVIADGGCSTVGAWPASPTVFDAKCTPNCDAGSCGSICPTAADKITGMPCDSGCCASNTATVTGVPFPNPGSGGGGLAWTAMAIGPAERIYFGLAGGTTAPDPSSFSYAATSDPRASLWPEVGTPDISATAPDAGPIARAESPLFAFGKSQSKDVVYAAYVTRPLLGGPAGGRFGMQDGSTWSFEELAAPAIAIAADAGGAALVLTRDHVMRRNAKDDWSSFCVPEVGSGSASAIAVDAAGSWYVASTGADHVVRVSRRSTNGAWTTENVTTGSPRAAAAAIALGAGTVHVAYTIDTSGDGGSLAGDLYYARRVGTSWVHHVAAAAGALPKASPSEVLSIGTVRMTIDACGAPHLGVFVVGTQTFDAYYLRFTEQGWRGARFENTCDANLSGGVALTAGRAFLSFWSCAFQSASIPLK